MAAFASESYSSSWYSTTVFVSLYQPHLHIRWQCLPLSVMLNTIQDGSVCLSQSYSTQYKTALMASRFQFQRHTVIGCNETRTVRWSPRAHLHVVGMLRLMPWHKPTELAHSFLIRSCVCFSLYGPVNCISVHKFSRQLSVFSLCFSGLIALLYWSFQLYVSLRKSPSALI